MTGTPTRRTVIAGMAGATLTTTAIALIPSAVATSADAKLFAIADECDRLHEVWRKSCNAYSDAEGPMLDKRRRGETVSEAELAKVKEAEALEAADSEAYYAVEVRLLRTQAHTTQGLATKLRIFRLYDGHKDEALFIDGFIADVERIGGAT